MAAYYPTENQIPLANSTCTHKAPIRFCDNLEEGFSVVPEAFFIYLFPGHSFKHHSHVVGTDMTPYVQYSFDGMYPGRVVYSYEAVDDTLLDAIRKDPGVDWVGCDITPGGIPQ
ncbi:hypothetical protein BU26DRAFT_523907 [Trematosphaeria pertusa]|uniref:Uncharacterized protein n=1 Tax=Trematosphaeria pertusa TaxID=390896 RepID=A0A6A6HYE3_9PLEO|nr:uncharacterized protein BU26DRAFT_523907 [Trematosphaeria pertusa]KAF2242909.1 hypothetical protein BU26DRAFT_523907 [Trematosphaeria pertusa]